MPASKGPDMEPSSAPLGDYFWIAGVDSLSYGQHFRLNPDTGEKEVNGVSSLPLESTIDEDRALETTAVWPAPSPRDSLMLENSLDTLASSPRMSRLSNERRFSTYSETNEQAATASNRSSATIRAVPAHVSGLSDDDFDRALRKFAVARESFLDELSVSAGAPNPPRSNIYTKPPRQPGEDANGARPGSSSVRRHLSLRDLNSMKRQPSVVRTASIRTSKRLSNYNSVIPAPQPLQAAPSMHPLKRRFEPVLLDRYPPRSGPDETARRGAFPDYVPMFAFPNDINIVSADERPRSTWHGFAMTSSDNSRIYGVCVTLWMPLNPRAAAEVERRCEEWRRDNMSHEERELAHSLGERLAMERAKLSELLAKLPGAASGSMAREALEDQISATEEKIGLMTDLLRPVRHGAASKIDGLTDGETGLWIPRAYGVLGRDAGMTTFWKEWLRAVVVPMTNGAILRVPPSSPKIGMWQPLERYVVNLCAEAPSPVSSKTQVEIAIRELRLYARREAINELPGSRSTDLYALFRALSIPNIMALFEFALSESRIILLSSHTAMLHLATRALCSLLYPFTWAGILIPVLPARLLSALEAPCPYIVGIDRRYDRIELPEDDFVLVDLDEDNVQSTAPPDALPRQQRRKLISLLQLAAPHHNRYGVPTGPPRYAADLFPSDAFSSETASVFTSSAPLSTLARYVSLNSTSFGAGSEAPVARAPLFNAFIRAKADPTRLLHERPSTGSTNKGSSPPSPQMSPTSPQYPPLPVTPISRSESGFVLASSLREKRSGHLDGSSRRSSSFGVDGPHSFRRPSVPFTHHASALSTSTLYSDGQSRYAPSSYAQSTIAASTIMPNVLHQPVKNSANVAWVEGHCLQWHEADDKSTCSVCEEKAEEGIYRCHGCRMTSHARCAEHIGLVCPVAFDAEQVRAAFVRCFASLLYTYRKFLHPATADFRKNGKAYRFNMDGFVRSIPRENAQYMQMLQQTQAFNEFIHERELKSAKDPSVMLFDQIILAKKNRGRTSFFSKSTTSFLQDRSDHLWRSAAAMPPTSRFPGDYRQVTTRMPAKLDPALMKEPRMIQGVPRIVPTHSRRKPIPSMLGLNTSTGDENKSPAIVTNS